MRPFIYESVTTLAAAVKAFPVQNGPLVQGRLPVEYLAGGTTLLDLMKLDVMRPARVVDMTGVVDRTGVIDSTGVADMAGGATLGTVEVSDAGLRLGALVKMSTAAAHPDIVKTYPVIAQSLQLAASAQLRNMATLGGNVLQRTRCTYFRDTAWTACNKRVPGSGCAAMDGMNRQHAVLGGSSDCIATYPGDFAQALLALDAEVTIVGPSGARTIPFARLHRPPGATPHVETVLTPGELITGFSVPSGAWTRRSLYLKIRDRQSYEFALASAAVALHMEGNDVRQARIALGGVATVPWRAAEAEAALAGRPLDEASAANAARIAFAAATPHAHNAFKVALGQSTLVRALLQAATLEG